MRTILLVAVYVLFPIVLLAEGGIAGLVTDRMSGDPIAGVTIRIDGTRLGAVTGKDGRFRIRRVPEGTLVLHASRVGYANENVTVVIRANDVKDVVLTMIESAVQGRDVVVSASKRVQAVQDVPISVAVMKSEDLQSRAITRLDDALAYVSGITVTGDQVNIRGSSGFALGVGSRTAVVMDGFPLLSGDNGDIKFDVLPVADIERVEIIKGAGSALYGTGALGGVVSIITKTPTEQADISARLYSGVWTLPRFDQWRYRETLPLQTGADVRYAQRFGDVTVSASGGLRTDESYRDFDASMRGFGFAKVGWAVNDRRTLTAQALYAADDRENYVFWRSFERATLTAADQDPSERLFSGKLSAGLEWSEILSGATSIVVRPSLYRTNYFNTIGGVEQDSNTSVAWAYGLEAQATSRLSDDVVITAGLNGRVNDVVSDVYGNQIQTLFAAYGQAEWTVQPGMIVTAGARIDREETITVDPNLVVSPKVGLSWALTDATSLRASLGRGFRAPTIAERYATIQYSAIRVVPAERLLPEFSWSAELGINQRFAGAPFPMELDVAVFNNELYDMIEPAFLPSGVVQFQNITRARVLGAEFTVRAMVASWAGVETGLTLMNPQDVTSGQTLKYRNNVIWYSRGSVRPFDGIEFQAEHRFLNRTEQIDALAVVPDYDVRVPIHIVDMRLLWTVANKTRMMLQVRNLLDYYYTTIMANLGPTRSVQVQVEWAL